MPYKYREVLCPLCEKKFMWLQTMTDGTSLGYYQDLMTGKKARRATCTSCATNLLVFDEILEGKLPDEYPNMRFIREYGV